MRRRGRGRQTLARTLAAVVAASPLAAAAAEPEGQVVLRLKEGAFEFTGRLRSFDGRSYLIDAGTFGTLALDAARYECAGEACTATLATTATLTPSTLILATPGERAADTFALEGSATVGFDLMPALIRDFAVSLGGTARQQLGTDPHATRFEIVDNAGAALTTIDLRRNGNSAGLEGVSGGRAAIAMASRAATPAEIAQLTPDAAPEQSLKNEHVLALDGLAVVVSPDNPLSSLSIDAIAGIFSGRITSWAQLGQPPAPIRVYSSADGGAVSDSLGEQVLRPRGLTLTGGALSVPNEAAISDAVAADPLAIGITSVSLIRNARALEIAGSCGLNSKPTPFAIKAEEYPLSRRIYLYTAGDDIPATARALTSFAATARAQDVIRDTQFVDQSIERVSFADQSRRLSRMFEEPKTTEVEKSRLRNLVAGLLDGQRLSITLRFATGSSLLDAKARQDVLRLRELLKGPELQGKTVHLIGFTDAAGSPGYNLALSRRRAEQVRSAVLAGDPSLLTGKAVLSKGFGHLSPVACNESAANLMLNRRVEVWITDGIAAVPPVAVTPRILRKSRGRRG